MTTTTRLPAVAGDQPAPRNSMHRGRSYAALAIAVVLVATVWIVAFSSVLGVKSVAVQGTRVLTAAQVRAAARVSQGTPLIRLDTASIVRRVEALPVVASARAQTSYPNTVVITVVERVAIGYVQSGSAFVLVDKTGDQFLAAEHRPRGLPLFALPGGADAQATGRAVASVAAALSASLLSKIASIQAFDPTSITLLLTDHRVVTWGSADRDADKARVLAALLSQPGTRYDITNPDQVFAH